MQDRVLDGRYRIGQLLGQGGMGTVWEAVDLRLERQVAVKIVGASVGVGGGTSPLASDPQAPRRFAREARLLAGLSSPYIVTVHDVGEASFDGQVVLYLVMERLHGRSLDQILGGELPPLPDVALWGEQVCRALAVAHGSGVVHRDLKPANVMVEPDGLARVLDFGIAAVLAESSDHARLTHTGVVVGTPSYMSPEQIESGGTVDARSDLYSLGCVLYALLTGRPPFHGGSLYRLLRQQMEDDPVPPSVLRVGLPAAWNTLVTALLAKRPEQRPDSAAEVAGRLRELAALSPAPAAAPPAGPNSPTVALSIPAVAAAETAAAYQPTRVDQVPPRARAVALASCPLPAGRGRLPLATGQLMRLADVLPGAGAFTVGVDWRASDGIDVDASAFVVDEHGRVLSDDHFVFYNNPEPAGLGIRLSGGDPEALFTVELPKLGERAARVVFALTVDESEGPARMDLSRVGTPHARLLDPDNGAELLCYGFPAGPPGCTGLTLGELVRDEDGDWSFAAASRGYPGGLAEVAESHGVDLEAP
jgi:serine/threonine-protein kinase